MQTAMTDAEVRDRDIERLKYALGQINQIRSLMQDVDMHLAASFGSVHRDIERALGDKLLRRELAADAKSVCIDCGTQHTATRSCGVRNAG